jgi:hypothetical protein
VENTIVEMDQEIKMESVAGLKEEIFIKIENFCEPKLETNESAVLEDPLNISSDAQGPFLFDIKSEIKTEISDVNENCSENVSWMKSSFQIPVSAIQSSFEKDFSSNNNAEEAEIPYYEKKRLENIAEKKAMFEEKLRNAKLAVKAKPFKCSTCLSDFAKKAQLKSHQCGLKCDLCNKYFRISQSFYKHDMNEHDGYFTKNSKLKRPDRERKPINRLVVNEPFSPLRPFNCSLCHKGFTCKYTVVKHARRLHFLENVTFEEIGYQSNDPLRENSACTELEEEKEYIIEKLLDKRYLGQKGIRIQYLVKWKDYGNEHNSWESKSNLPGNIVKSFEEGQWIKNQLLESEPRTNQN